MRCELTEELRSRHRRLAALPTLLVLHAQESGLAVVVAEAALALLLAEDGQASPVG